MELILQNLSSAELRAVRHAVRVGDGIHEQLVSLEGLPAHKEALQRGAMPVGSVEFVHAALLLIGRPIPPGLSYAPGARDFLSRDVKLCRVSDVQARRFVKPQETKLFTGFVYDPASAPDASCEHYEDWAVLMRLHEDTFVWSSEVVEWQCEWRYYVQDGEVIGSARYDPLGEEDAPLPDQNIVSDCIAALDLRHPYALDMGVLASGKTALVEVNGAYSIGLYGRALEPMVYLNFLHKAWVYLLSQ